MTKEILKQRDKTKKKRKETTAQNKRKKVCRSVSLLSPLVQKQTETTMKSIKARSHHLQENKINYDQLLLSDDLCLKVNLFDSKEKKNSKKRGRKKIREENKERRKRKRKEEREMKEWDERKRNEKVNRKARRKIEKEKEERRRKKEIFPFCFSRTYSLMTYV